MPVPQQYTRRRLILALPQTTTYMDSQKVACWAKRNPVKARPCNFSRTPNHATNAQLETLGKLALWQLSACVSYLAKHHPSLWQSSIQTFIHSLAFRVIPLSSLHIHVYSCSRNAVIVSAHGAGAGQSLALALAPLAVSLFQQLAPLCLLLVLVIAHQSVQLEFLHIL